MPTESNAHAEITRLTAARDEALQRYTRHLAAIQLRNSRWCAALSRGRSAFRRHLLPLPVASLKTAPHAH
ncbi:MAG TPA: hypothetical protein VGD97_12655 [Lacunisphaera sp.]